jgi:hypothetical protein
MFLLAHGGDSFMRMKKEGISQGLKPDSGADLDVQAKAWTYLRSNNKDSTLRSNNEGAAELLILRNHQGAE